jgi:hypothetical protein
MDQKTNVGQIFKGPRIINQIPKTMKTINESKPDLKKIRNGLRTLVRAREDFQAMRKRMDNRLGRKADGTNQNVGEREFDVTHV